MTFSHLPAKEWIPRENNYSFLRSTVHQAKFSPLRKNGVVVLKVRAVSIEISGSPKEPNLVNTADGVGRPS